MGSVSWALEDAQDQTRPEMLQPIVNQEYSREHRTDGLA